MNDGVNPLVLVLQVVATVAAAVAAVAALVTARDGRRATRLGYLRRVESLLIEWDSNQRGARGRGWDTIQADVRAALADPDEPLPLCRSLSEAKAPPDLFGPPFLDELPRARAEIKATLEWARRPWYGRLRRPAGI